MWSRDNRGELITPFYDMDSIANGLGGYDNPDMRSDALSLVNERIRNHFTNGHSFGVESTYSGQRGPSQVTEAIANGYQIHGIYIGTKDPKINIRRVARRVSNRTGHYVPDSEVERRWSHSLSNLRKTLLNFDSLVLLDNTTESKNGIPNTTLQCRFAKGELVEQREDQALSKWCLDFLERIREMDLQKAIREERGRRKESRRKGMESHRS